MVPGKVGSKIVSRCVKTGNVVDSQRGGTGMMAATRITVLLTLVKAAIAGIVSVGGVVMLATGVSRSLDALAAIHVHHHTIGLQRHDHQGQAQQERTDCSGVI